MIFWQKLAIKKVFIHLLIFYCKSGMINNMDMTIRKKEIGLRLKTVRKRLEMTQQQFAGLLGIARETYTKLELGENMPTAPHLINITEKFKISSDWVLNGETEFPDFGILNTKIREMLHTMSRDEALTYAVLSEYCTRVAKSGVSADQKQEAHEN